MLLAVLIFSLILLPVFLTFSTGTANIKTTEAEFKAHLLTLELMEQLTSLPYKHIPVGEFSTDFIKKSAVGKSRSSIPFKVTAIGNMEPKVKIQLIKKKEKEKFKKIEISTTFLLNKASKLKRVVTLKTLVANEKN